MRVVSLCPSLTELVFDLGAGEKLVGRTRYCVEPAGRIEVVPALGGTKNPKIADILRLKPTLVLLNQEENRRQDVEALSSAGVRCLVLYPRTIEDTATMVRQLAGALRREASGEQIAREIETSLIAARDSATRSPTRRWLYLIWRKPWMAVGQDTYIDSLLSAAGGENVLHYREDRYPSVTEEEIVHAAPDRILLSSEPFPFKKHHADELAAATGFSPETFVLVNGQDLSWHGSRTPRGLEAAVKIFSKGIDP